MKGIGIFFVILAVLNFIVGIIATANGAPEVFGNKLAGAMMLGALGGFLWSRANAKKEEANKKDEWENK